LLRYQILTNSDLKRIFQVNEELASRLKEAVKSAQNLDDLVEKVATKRYTKARVRRILTYILVQAVEKPLPEAIHVLGFSQRGQDYLKTIKHSVNLVSRIGSESWDELTQQADVVYQLGNEQIGRASLWARAGEGEAFLILSVMLSRDVKKAVIIYRWADLKDSKNRISFLSR
jgi:hypothetical protein